MHQELILILPVSLVDGVLGTTEDPAEDHVPQFSREPKERRVGRVGLATTGIVS